MAVKKVFISGKVQGVGFRFHAHEEAVKLGLKGWVRNLSDGRVEILVSGNEKEIKDMIKWAHRGPQTARVEKVEVQDTNEAPTEAFYIKREGDTS